MARNVIQIHPEKIISGGFKSDNFFNIHISISAETKLNANDILSVQITLDQAKELHSILGAQINLRNAE
ncbi:hypothetical protein [Pectobacterium sp. CHL-2024]|uniref:hypothetical protein n=1 Tax=Pectobacterium sp. CHL-2024 TaxID=3377079 RepID=UPI0038207D8B